MSLKRLAGLVRYLHHLSAQLVARAKGLPEPPHPQDHCRHAWITLKRRRFCQICRRLERRGVKWRPDREHNRRTDQGGWSTGGWN